MKKELFTYISATQFLPTFCGMEVTPMIRHKIRGTDGNGKPVDFSDAEKEKINQGVKKFYQTFATGDAAPPLTLESLLDGTDKKQVPFKLKNGRSEYDFVQNSTGELVIVGRGTSRRWLPRSTPIELLDCKTKNK